MRPVLIIVCILFPLLNGFAIPSVIPSTKGGVSSNLPAVETQLRDAQKRLFRTPVDAKIDRVWHAIPGLNGWELDYQATLQKTKQAHDGQLHPVLKEVPPKIRVSDLPPEPIYRGPDAERTVCLMFNVSWGEKYVPSILKTLRQNHVHVTFFLDGAWVKKYPDLARQIVMDGHAIGSHGLGHPDFRRLNNPQVEQQVRRANDIILEAVGKNPRLLAPPAGSYDNRTVTIARSHGMYTILWTADTIDWRRPPVTTIVSRAVHGSGPGALILMHPTAPTAEALPQIISSIKAKGYRFKTVDQVIDERSIVEPAWSD